MVILNWIFRFQMSLYRILTYHITDIHKCITVEMRSGCPPPIFHSNNSNNYYENNGIDAYYTSFQHQCIPSYAHLRNFLKNRILGVPMGVY